MNHLGIVFVIVAAGLLAQGCAKGYAEGPAPTPKIAAAASQSWKDVLADELPKLGHRNWVAVVDSAYPWQAKGGIETVVTGEDQLDVVKYVLNAVNHTQHVRPVIFLDKELDYVPETAAPGIGQYRTDLSQLLAGQKLTPTPMLHNDVISMLDKSGETFHVLLLKTNMTKAYTSVFIRLDCGYWSDEDEANLRKAMGGG